MAVSAASIDTSSGLGNRTDTMWNEKRKDSLRGGRPNFVTVMSGSSQGIWTGRSWKLAFNINLAQDELPRFQ